MKRNDVNKAQPDRFRSVSMPKNARYIDEVLDEEFILKDFMVAKTWQISMDAKKHTIRFSRIPKYMEISVKTYLATYLLNQKIPAVIDSFHSVSAFIGHIQFDMRFVDIFELKIHFVGWINSGKSVIHYAPVVRRFLMYLAENNFGLLKKSYSAQIQSWPVPKTLKNSRALNGSYKLSFYEEFKINEYLELEIDYFASIFVINMGDRDIKRLINSTIIALCMSFGLRPKQLAMLKVGSIQKFGEEEEYYDISVPIIKQKNKGRDYFRKALPSKWQLLLIKWWNFKKSHLEKEEYITAPLLSLTKKFSSPIYFTEVTKDVSKQLMLEPKTVYHFRHTFAQRMADCGASAAEISIGLTQTTTETAQSYVSATASMARILSQALGQSEVYKNLPSLFAGRLIIRKEMERAHIDKHVTGVVDGVLMPGIGLCSIKVNLCERSPLLACHTCPKFLPLMDERPHILLANQLREVVYRFKSIEKDENMPSSPIMKLGDTLAIIEKLLDEIKEAKKGSKNE